MAEPAWKTPFRFKDVHHCEAAVLSCIDFRFRQETEEFVRSFLGFQEFDPPKLPGSTQSFGTADQALALKCITVPAKLHGVKTFILVHHQDCGAYGGSSSFNGDAEREQHFHEKELRSAKEIIQEIYPEKPVIMIYIRISGDKENLEFMLVE